MSDQEALPIDVPRRRRSRKVHGPVYQGVCAQVRHYYGTSKTRTDDQAKAFGRVVGYVVQARSLAESIDRVSGHEPGTRQATGHQLAELHERLAELLEKLTPAEAEGGDKWDRFLERLTDPRMSHGHATPPLPQD